MPLELVAGCAWSLLATGIVSLFLENWDSSGECALASADWLKRHATKDTFVVGKETYERIGKACLKQILRELPGISVA
jgi:hypothetical protein